MSSVAVLPLAIAGDTVGWLRLGSRRRHYFDAESAALLRRVAETLALVAVGQGAEAALRERVKELTCLYSLSRVAERPGISLQGLLQGAVELLPPAWQYPEIAVARIEVEGESCSTPGFDRAVCSQSSAVRIRGEDLGRVEVGYISERPELDEGPFLREERSLIDAVARELAAVIERRKAAAERALLERQLRHADRLATVGQLAAGLAHELNEPLAAILGFAQLSQKADGLPEEPRQDLGKIATAALHAREIVRNLMLFARQSTPKTESLDLNEAVRDGLELLGSRCARSGVEVECFLEEELPRIVADRSQLQQVLVNLVVNALQAMPEGGRLELRTRSAGGSVGLLVKDDGVGMGEEVRGKIFLPFFTTKDVDQGTGLGLAVVHGIVASHGGAIMVESEPGRGSTFEVELPLGGTAGDTKEASGERQG
jgi:two-component system, NtrC family, sensor kinase